MSPFYNMCVQTRHLLHVILLNIIHCRLQIMRTWSIGLDAAINRQLQGITIWEYYALQTIIKKKTTVAFVPAAFHPTDRLFDGIHQN